MTDNHDTNPNDDRDDPRSQTTRRAVLTAAGLGGLAALGSSGASADLAGGPEADAMSEYRVPTYRVPESDLDTPGVVGRRVEITAGGGAYSAGDQLVDLGDRWELVSPNYGSVSAEYINNATVYADKPTGNTTTDEEILKDARDKLPSDGGTLVLRNGTYLVEGTYSDGAILKFQKPVYIKAQGSGTIKLADNGTENNEGARIIEIGGNPAVGEPPNSAAGSIVGANVTIDGNQQNNYGQGDGNTIDKTSDGHNCAIYSDNVRFLGNSKNSTGDGVEFFSGATNCKVIGANLIDNWEQAVHLNGCTNATVAGCTIEGGYSNGQISTFCASNKTTENVTITGNVMRGGQTDAIALNPGDGSLKDVTVTGNTIKGVGGQGIIVFINPNNADNVASEVGIKDNTITGAGRSGIFVQAGEMVDVKDNIIKRSQGIGILLRAEGSVNGTSMLDVTVEDNTIKDPLYNTNLSSNQSAIFVSADVASIDTVAVDDNTITSRDANSDMRSGILGADPNGLSNFYIRDNDITGNSAAAIFSSTYDIVNGNNPSRPVDVRNLKAVEGNDAYHDGSGSNTEGPAYYTGFGWTSLVDGSTIS